MAPTPTSAHALRLAHRGDHRSWPENSLAAIAAGASAPRSDGVEFDVRRAGDGAPVVIHDPTLLRVQGLHARVEALDTERLAAHGVPSLADVLAALPPPTWLNVELKVVPDEMVAAVLRAARGARPTAVVVSSFETDALRALRDALPGWPRWLNVEQVMIPGRVHPADAVAAALDLGCRGIAAQWRLVTPRFAEQVLAAGLTLAAFTVRREPTIERLERLGTSVFIVEGRPLD